MQWHTPIGYKVTGGKITVCEEHRKLVEQIFHDYDSGVSAWRIAKDLKENGIKNANDRVSWTHVSIGRILENHNYLGTEYYPQIIDRELFDRVQKRREQIRSEGNRGTYRPNKKERLIFGGKIICGECGEPYRHIQPQNKKECYGVPKWKCKNYVYQNRLSCKGGFISDSELEEVCIFAMNSLIRNPGQMKNIQKKEAKISAEYRRLDSIIASSEGMETDEKMKVLFQRAAERYKTLEIRDEDIRIKEMQKALSEREEIAVFDEELFRALIKQIIVYKDNSVTVIFQNNSRMKIGYGHT